MFSRKVMALEFQNNGLLMGSFSKMEVNLYEREFKSTSALLSHPVAGFTCPRKYSHKALRGGRERESVRDRERERDGEGRDGRRE